MPAAKFRLTTMPRADQEVRDLLRRAASLGITKELIDALKAVTSHLRMKPTEIGDPARRTRKQGGMVYSLVVEPVFIQYAVFEREKTVFLLDVKPLSRFFPE